MINEKAMRQIEELSTLYEQRWGKSPDFMIRPPKCSQEMLVQILALIVDTGDSILIGWEKLNQSVHRDPNV